MKRPSFQFYGGAWLSNAKLRRCSYHLKGVWIDTLAILADGDEFGVFRGPLSELAKSVGCRIADLRDLHARQILKGSEAGFEGHFFTPKHARKKGDPVCVLAPCDEPVFFSSMQVELEYKRKTSGGKTRFGSDDGDEGDTPELAPSRRQGDGSSSSPSPSLKSIPPNPPSGDVVPRSKRRGAAITFAEFMTRCRDGGEKPIGHDDPIWQFADDAKLPAEFIRIHWLAFRERYRDAPKRYIEWRKVFRNSVRENWFKCWYHDPSSNAFALTTVGQTYRRVLNERDKGNAAAA